MTSIDKLETREPADRQVMLNAGHKCHALRVGLKVLAMLVFGLTVAKIAAVGQKSCPLTEAQSEKAVAAFGKIAAFVLKEPRCVNCHGGVNPHIGGVGLDPEDPNLPASLVKHGGGLVLRDPEEVKRG